MLIKEIKELKINYNIKKKVTICLLIIFKEKLKEFKGYTFLPNKFDRKTRIIYLGKKNIKNKKIICINNLKKINKKIFRKKINFLFIEENFYEKIKKNILNIIKRKKINIGYEYGNIINNNDLIKKCLKNYYVQLNLNNKENTISIPFASSNINKKKIIENLIFILDFVKKKILKKPNKIKKILLNSTYKKIFTHYEKN